MGSKDPLIVFDRQLPSIHPSTHPLYATLLVTHVCTYCMHAHCWPPCFVGVGVEMVDSLIESDTKHLILLLSFPSLHLSLYAIWAKTSVMS